MAQFIKHQTEKYDYVIIDGPPALIVGDVKLLARIVDGTILVFNASSTQRGTAERVISELRQVNANILGCVLFGVHSFKGGYFKEQFKAYQEYQKVQFPKPAVS
jgi:Mrp family chromosome partitioning ATPase